MDVLEQVYHLDGDDGLADDVAVEASNALKKNCRRSLKRPTRDVNTLREKKAIDEI